DLAVLAALHSEMRDTATGRCRQDGRGGAAQIEVENVEIEEIRRGVAVQGVTVRIAGAVRVEREDGVSPMMLRGVECAIARCHVDAVRGLIVDDAGPPPDGRLRLAYTVRRAGHLDEMHV